MRLRAAVVGDLQGYMRLQKDLGAKAVTEGMRAATDGLKQELRGQVRRAGLGNKVANAWRGETYPKGKTSMGAGGFIWSKAPHIHSAFDRGGVIRSRQGRFLAIPTEAAGKRAIGGRINPTRWELTTGRRLRFVYRKNGPSLLVAEMRVRRGKRGVFSSTLSKTAKRTGRGLATVPIFILVPFVRLRKTLNIDAATRHWQGRLPHLVLRAWRDA